MKKSIFFLTMAAVVMTGCLKDEAVDLEQAQEITLSAVAKTATKADADIHDGTFIHADYRIYASATERKLDGTIENPSYFKDQAFDTATPGETAEYHACTNDDSGTRTPIYWPLGGCVLDYIAYAMPYEDHKADVAMEGPHATYDNELTDVASLVSFKGWNTYDNQVDLLYAALNGTTTAKNEGANKVNLTFNHAQALLQFNATVNEDQKMTIESIEIDGLLVEGDFIVDNTKNTLNAYWQNLKAIEGKDLVMPDSDRANDNLGEPLPAGAADTQVGSMLLIPSQPALNFVVTYTINEKEMTYEYNHLRKSWEMGKKYVYNLDFELNEIIITEDVVEFVEDSTDVDLS